MLTMYPVRLTIVYVNMTNVYVIVMTFIYNLFVSIAYAV